MEFILKKLLMALFIIFANPTYAYIAVSETAEIPSTEKYRIGFEPQILLNQGGGINATFFLDRGINESTSGRVYLGAGAQDFTFGGSAKYIPFPDYDKQPAMGLRLGARYTRLENTNFLSLELTPIISKVVDTEKGLFHPYIAVPINYFITKESNYVGTSMAFGNEWHNITNLEKATAGAEIGFSLNDSYSYISGYITYPLEQTRKGF